MNFQQLEYVLAVDQHKHFAKAADACHVTQATLSGMIKKLEEELGIVMFDRSRQPVKTTDEGKKSIEIARDILNRRNDLRKVETASSFNPGGKLRIGIIPTVANSLLPMILPHLLSKYPNLNLNIAEITTDEILHQLESDQIDAGILATPLNNKTVEENILYYESLMIYGVKKNDRKYISTKNIRDQNIWLLEEGNCFRDQASFVCDIRETSKGLENLHFEGSSFDTLLNLTDRFGGYTLIPELYYNQLPEDKRRKTRHFEKPTPVREISMIYYRPYARKMTLDLLSKEIAELIKADLTTTGKRASELEIVGI